MLEAKIVELNLTRYKDDGTTTPHGINERIIHELAADGWQMTTVFEPPGRPTPLGVFYRKVQSERQAAPEKKVETPAPKKVGRPRKTNA